MEQPEKNVSDRATCEGDGGNREYPGPNREALLDPTLNLDLRIDPDWSVWRILRQISKQFMLGHSMVGCGHSTTPPDA
jgi:hypothetical protein